MVQSGVPVTIEEGGGVEKMMAMNVSARGASAALGLPDNVDAPVSIDTRIDNRDADALRRIASGADVQGPLRDVFARHWDAVARSAYRITGDEDDARDAAQEAFIRLHQKPPPPDTALRAWLCRVATNQAVNDLRAGRRRIARQVRHGSSATQNSADGIAEANLRAEQSLVRETLLGLPERARDLLVLRSEGFRYHEIATVLGVAPGSVGTLLARAEQAFREGYVARRGGA